MKETASGGKYTADLEYIATEEYKAKFNGVFPKQRANVEICREARRAIRSNSGTANESFALITRNGEKIGGGRTGAFGGAIDLSAISGAVGNSVVLVHNHPLSMSFSADDISTLVRKRQIKTIIAAGHNGTIYKLSVGTGLRPETSEIYHTFNLLYNKIGDVDKVVKNMAETNKWIYEVI